MRNLQAVQNTVFPTNKTLKLNGRILTLDSPRLMGILNVTPDSFFDGGRHFSEASILSQVEKMLREGADIIDVGGYSTRPGATEVPVGEEISRVRKAIALITEHFPGTFISIDTFRSEVARAAVGEGAAMVNDISGGGLDPLMWDTVADLRVPYVLMHMRGDPSTMAGLTQYRHLVKEVLDYFHPRLFQLKQRGVADVIVDPGFGFAKTREQNFQLLTALDQLHITGHPLLVGLSRKSMIWKTLEIEPDAALNGTTALNAIALTKGAQILRVHDVKEAREVIRLITALRMSTPA